MLQVLNKLTNYCLVLDQNDLALPLMKSAIESDSGSFRVHLPSSQFISRNRILTMFSHFHLPNGRFHELAPLILSLPTAMLLDLSLLIKLMAYLYHEALIKPLLSFY